MEDEKKKKKNKKKKNKQAKTAEAVAVGIEGSASADQTVNGFEQDHQGHVFKTADIPNDVPKSDMYLDRHHTSGSVDVSFTIIPIVILCNRTFDLQLYHSQNIY